MLRILFYCVIKAYATRSIAPRAASSVERSRQKMSVLVSLSRKQLPVSLALLLPYGQHIEVDVRELAARICGAVKVIANHRVVAGHRRHGLREIDPLVARLAAGDRVDKLRLILHFPT